MTCHIFISVRVGFGSNYSGSIWFGSSGLDSELVRFGSDCVDPIRVRIGSNRFGSNVVRFGSKQFDPVRTAEYGSCSGRLGSVAETPCASLKHRIAGPIRGSFGRYMHVYVPDSLDTLGSR